MTLMLTFTEVGCQTDKGHSYWNDIESRSTFKLSSPNEKIFCLLIPDLLVKSNTDRFFIVVAVSYPYE